MGFDTGLITLDSVNNTYYAGQTLSGKLQFQQDKVKTFRGIYVQVKGYAHVHWTSRHSRRVNGKTESVTVNHEGREEYFRIQQYLIGNETGEVKLKPGNHEFPFQCTIPPHCPTSFEGKHGHIRYEIKFVVNRAFKLDQEKGLTFRVIKPTDLNLEPNCKEPIAMEFLDTYCCWCIRGGCCETVVKVPVSGFCAGQKIPIELSCKNESNVEIKYVKLSVKKDIAFYAHSAPGTKRYTDEVATMKKGPIPAHTTRNWMIEFDVPAMDIYNVTSCGIIDIDYNFKVKVSPSGCHSNSEDSRRIIFGDVPLRGLQDDVVNPLIDQMPQIQAGSLQSGYPGGYGDIPAPVGYPAANFGQPHPVAAPYPASPAPAPAPYPNNTPYPTGNTPYPQGNSPYPAGNTPYPTGKSPYPQGNSPYPAGNSPYPAGNTPYSQGISPYPPGNSPHPQANSPYAPGNSPYPQANSPYAPGSSPYPPGIAPPPMNMPMPMPNVHHEAAMPLIPNNPYTAPSAPPM